MVHFGVLMLLMDKIKMLELSIGEIAIFWLGQNSFILKTSGRTMFAIDPYLTRDARYSYVHPDPPIKPEELRVHYVFCTHDHSDHTDPQALPIIARSSPETLFFGPHESCKHLIDVGVEDNRVKALKAGVPYSVRDLEVIAYHSVPPDEADTTHFGYIFDVEGIKIYNMGDTCQSVVMKPEIVLDPIIKESPDIVMLPIVGDTPERRPGDAFKFATILRPKVVIPCHYGCFKDRTVDPKVFADLFKDTSDIRPVIIEYKGKYVYKSKVGE